MVAPRVPSVHAGNLLQAPCTDGKGGGDEQRPQRKVSTLFSQRGKKSIAPLPLTSSYKMFLSA